MRGRMIAVVVTALLGGSLLVQPVRSLAQAQPQPVAPYRIGFTGNAAGPHRARERGPVTASRAVSWSPTRMAGTRGS